MFSHSFLASQAEFILLYHIIKSSWITNIGGDLARNAPLVNCSSMHKIVRPRLRQDMSENRHRSASHSSHAMFTKPESSGYFRAHDRLNVQFERFQIWSSNLGLSSIEQSWGFLDRNVQVSGQLTLRFCRISSLREALSISCECVTKWSRSCGQAMRSTKIGCGWVLWRLEGRYQRGTSSYDSRTG